LLLAQVTHQLLKDLADQWLRSHLPHCSGLPPLLLLLLRPHLQLLLLPLLLQLPLQRFQGPLSGAAAVAGSACTV
jgi:hypothetical protein